MPLMPNSNDAGLRAIAMSGSRIEITWDTASEKWRVEQWAPTGTPGGFVCKANTYGETLLGALYKLLKPKDIQQRVAGEFKQGRY